MICKLDFAHINDDCKLIGVLNFRIYHLIIHPGSDVNSIKIVSGLSVMSPPFRFGNYNERLANVVRVIKSRTLRLVCYVARI